VNFELLRVSIALVGVGFAAWQDARTSYIDDRVLYAMIIAGALLNLATLDYEFISSTFLVFAFIMLLGYFAFKAGQFGAGDVYLFAAIQLLLPVYPQIGSPFAVPDYLLLFPFVFSVFVAASLFATIGSALLYAFKLHRAAPLLFKKPKAALFYTLAIGGAALAFWLGFGLAVTVALVLLLESALFMLLFKDEISEKVIVKRVALSKVEDEDVLALDKMPALKRLGIGRVATKEVIARLRKARVSSVWVHKDLPRFGPCVFLALLACLAAGDVVAFLLLR